MEAEDFVFTVVLIVVVGSLSAFIGYNAGDACVRDEATKAGVAEWVLKSPTKSDTEFRWKTNK